ncbi:hypothetical protein Bca52824_089149 [Brassica carinata]|uniref:Uncharacterized protein n=1 Tax=Brassica carinata TaxID=52824 RepID=A0A8X7PCQ6_BRACI|nr:hypothetical protein Bca52824_089149 [Brassica carinata]
MWSILNLRSIAYIFPNVPWEMTISDATDSAVYVAFEAEMSKLTNVRAAGSGRAHELCS